MSLKYMLDSLDGLTEHVIPLYESVEGGKFRLNVEGVAPREKLDEFRNNNIELLKKLDDLKDIDPVKFKSLLAIEKRLTDKELVEAGKVDEVVQSRVQTMKTEHDGIVTTLNEQLLGANVQLENLLIDSAVRVKALELGVKPLAIDDVMLRAKNALKLLNGVAVPHANGKPMYGKDGVNVMSVDEWITDLSKSAEHLFSTNTGGGASGSRGNGQPQNGKLSSVQKIAAGLAA